MTLPTAHAHTRKPPRKHVVPALWVADAICETGRNPPNWRFHSGVYQGGIAFYYTTFDAWKQHVPAARRYGDADEAPPWIQALVAEWGLWHGAPGSGPHKWGCLFHADVWAHRR